MTYDEKIKAMRALEQKQSSAIFGESDEDKKSITDSDDQDEEMVKIKEEQKMKQEKAQRRKLETDPSKWQGSGLEDLISMSTPDKFIKESDTQKSRQYQDPMEKRKQKNEEVQRKKEPLFPKSKKKDESIGEKYINLDGQIVIDQNFNGFKVNQEGISSIPMKMDEKMRAGIQHSVSHNMQLKKKVESSRGDFKNRFVSSSKFFILSQAQQLSCHHSQNRERIEQQQEGVRVFDRNQQPVPSEQQKSKNLSVFGQQHQAAAIAIPMVKDWFKQLTVTERVHCLTTIDEDITENMKKMHTQLGNNENKFHGKFQLKVNKDKDKRSYQMTVTQKGQTQEKEKKKQLPWVFSACNSKAFKSTQEQIDNEFELLKMINLTDTFTLHDTLTISEELVQDPNTFWSLGEKIAGGNFAYVRHTIDYNDKFEFESNAPLWFQMPDPNSLAMWCLYFLERALWIQFNNHVHGMYTDARDSQKTPIFIRSDNKIISLREEMKPFWRALIENPAQRHDANLSEQFKTKALIFFNIYSAPSSQDKEKKQQVDIFSGGLSMHESTQKPGMQPLVEKIAQYAKDLELALDSGNQVSGNLCVDSLLDCGLMHQDEASNLNILADRYIFYMNKGNQSKAQSVSKIQQTPVQQNMQSMGQEYSKLIVMRLDRVFAEIFREYMDTKLSSGFTSKNSKLLKKKAKKKLKKELEKEKQRELDAEKGKQEQSEGKIIVKSDNAIDLLMGKNESHTEKAKIEDKTSDQDIIDVPSIQHTTLSEKKNSQVKDQGKQQIDDSENNTDMFNYFQWRDQNQDSSQQSTIKTGSTHEDTQLQKVQKVQTAEQIEINAMSNQEFFQAQKRFEQKIKQEGNAVITRKNWQRSVAIKNRLKEQDSKQEKGYSQMVNELIDDDEADQKRSQIQESNSNYKIIDVRTKQGKLYAHKDNLEKNNDDSSSSSPSDDSEQDLLPDLFFQKFEPQPHDNDSSDYGEAVEDEELDAEQEEDDMIVDDDSSAAQSKPQSSSPNKQIKIQEKKKPKKKLTAEFSTKKSIKSAHPKMKSQSLVKENPEKQQAINFYKVDEIPDTKGNEDNVAKKVSKKKKKPLNLPVRQACYEQLVIESEDYYLNFDEPGKKKKNKKKKPKNEQVNQPEVKEEIKQIEIIKPQIEIIRPQPPPTAKKVKSQPAAQVQKAVQPQKKKKKDAADAMNEFMKSLHQVEAKSPPKQAKDTKNDEAANKKKDDKKVSQVQNPVGQAGKFQKKPLVHQNNPEQRLSNVEEAHILGSGNYRYEVKSKKAEEELKTEEKKALKRLKESKKDKTEIASEEIKPLFKEKKVKEAPTTSGNMSLTEFKSYLDDENQSIEKETSVKSHKSVKLDLQEAISSTLNKPDEGSDESKKSKMSRKRKNARSSKAKKKKQALQQNYIDPVTGQTVVMDLNQMIQGAATTQQPYQGQQMGMDMSTQAMINAVGMPFMGQQTQMNTPKLPQQQNNLQQLLYNLSQSGLIQMAADLQKRQQQEQMAYTQQMLQDTEPCPEEDPELYDKFYDLLEDEMKDKVLHIEELRNSVHKEREGLINLISTTIKETFASHTGNSYVGIKTFGSNATDLAIETSDVDLVVIGMDVGQSSRDFKNKKEQHIKSMQRIYDCLLQLRDKGQIQSIQLIATASVPIIKLVADLEVINQIQMEKALGKAKQAKLEERRKNKKTKANDDEEESKVVELDFLQLGIEAKQIDQRMRFLKVDISIDEQTQSQAQGKPIQGMSRAHSGIETIYHIKQLCKQRKDLRPIVMIIKKILDETYLSMPYHGGISSLSLVLMVSAYLKNYDPDKQAPLSTNLFGFFHFYSTGFKPELHYLDGDQIQFCDNKALRPFRDAALVIIDPMDRNNNVSSSSFNIQEIQMAFIRAFKINKDACLQFQRNGHIKEEELDSVDEYIKQCQPKYVLQRVIDDIHDTYYQQQGYYDDDNN